MTEIALALRSELYKRSELLDFARLTDSSSHFSHLFFPDIPNGQESIELSIASLAITKRVKVGSGVIRLSEHDPKTFARRLSTIQFLSNNRFVLGIGTGTPGPSPGRTIEQMFSRLDEVKENFSKSKGDESIEFPRLFIATLRSHMAKIAIKKADGALFNFCSPEYLANLISEMSITERRGKTVACYVKVFYSEKPGEAEKSLIKEFVKYDTLPQYHSMFQLDGTSDAILDAGNRLSSGGTKVPPSFKRICLANPSIDQLSAHLEKFIGSGSDLPCIYPYFGEMENTEFKTSTIKSILSLELT